MNRPRYNIRQFVENDVELLLNWFQRDHISDVWFSIHNKTQEQLREKYSKRLRDGIIHMFIMQLDQQDIGYLQAYELEPGNPYEMTDKAVGLDIFIGESEHLGKGHGTRLLTEFLRKHVFSDPEIVYACIDPELYNERAIQSYEKVGFHIQTIKYDKDSRLLTCYMLLHRKEFFVK